MVLQNAYNFIPKANKTSKSIFLIVHICIAKSAAFFALYKKRINAETLCLFILKERLGFRYNDLHFQVIKRETIITGTRGLLHISAVCKDIVKHRSNLGEWAVKFSPNLTSFKEALKDFEKSNVEKYLKSVFRLRCSDSLDSMYKAFR